MTAVVAAVAAPASAEDLRLAVHESAHAVAAIRFGYHILALTIDDDGGGGCLYHQRPASNARLPTTLEMQSFQLWPMETRRLFERRYALSAVAKVAEETYAPRTGGYRPPAAVEGERKQIVQELEDAGFEWLVDGSELEEPLERQTDEAKMTLAARLGVPSDDLSALYTAWMLRDLESWVASEPFHRPLAALTRELLRYRSLSGEHVRRVVAQVDDGMQKEADEYGTH